MQTCWRSLLVALGLGVLVSMSVRAQVPERAISVRGEGVVRVVPDQATIRLGIVTIDEDPEEARRRNAEASREAMNAVRELGIDERKIRMELLRLQPRREYDPDTRRTIDVGFEAERLVVVELDDLEKLPALVARVVQRGANRIESITYGLADEDVVREEALRAAVVNARAKAQLIAETLGVSLGPVQRVDEQSFDFPRPVFAMQRMEMSAAKDAAEPEPAAYAAGEIEVRTSVHAVFGLGD